MARIGMWDITSSCNLNCKHCYNKERYWSNSSNYPEFTHEQIEIIINKLSDMKFTRLHLLGGEPLLSKNLDYIIEYGNKKGLSMTMVTNGTMMTAEVSKKLISMDVKSISISLDGISEETNDLVRGDGVFQVVTKNIKDFLNIKKEMNSNIAIGIGFTITKQNLNEVSKLLDFAHEAGLDGINVSYLSQEGSAKENWDSINISQIDIISAIEKLVQMHKKYSGLQFNLDCRSSLAEYLNKKYDVKIETSLLGCKGANEQFYILADGTLLPCSPAGTSMGQKARDKGCYVYEEMPNLLKQDVENIVNSNALTQFYNFANNQATYEHISTCKKCKHTCYPCPLMYIEYNIVEECEIAMNLLNKLDKDMLNSIVKVNDTIRKKEFNNNIEILDFYTQNYYTLNGIGYDIYKAIEKKQNDKLADILSIIYNDYRESVDFENFQADCLEFVYDLKMNKIIHII